MKLRIRNIIIVLSGVVAFSSCKKFLDINKNPDRLPSSFTLYPQLLTNAQVSLGFEAGSDLYRYSALIMQHMSGLASAPNQTYEYSRYNITGSDENNLWGQMYANTLSDLELIIKQATTDGSPHYVGLAKVLKAYEMSIAVDTWGDIPYSEAWQLDGNTQPKYDDDATIYPKLIALLAEAVTDLNAATSKQSPGTNSVIYTNSDWNVAKAFWVKAANTIRLRLLLHYSKLDPAFTVAQITALVNTAGIQFFTSNADNFQVNFFNSPNQRNPIETFERNRLAYLYADQQIVGMMNARTDPRRPFYFVDFPFGSGQYVGVSAANPPAIAGNSYSRVHTFLRGAILTGTTPPFTYTGAAPARMLSFAEYNFIRAEAALMGAPGNAQQFFTDGITASMTEAGVAPGAIAAYLAVNGTLTGTNAQKLQQIIEEKYVASYGVSVEPWTDYRRTGFPALTPAANRIATVTTIPRVLFYAQSEIDLNPKILPSGGGPGQKTADLQGPRVFWDKQ